MTASRWTQGRRAWMPLAAIILALVTFWAVGRQTMTRGGGLPRPDGAGGGSTVKSLSDRAGAVGSPPTPIGREADTNMLSRRNWAAPPAADQIKTDTIPPINSRVIKTASLTVKVKRHGFDRAYDRAALLAQANGGYVAGSTSSAALGNLASGTITIRIPADAFEKVVTELKRLGKVQALDVQSQDVSQEYVDLESRLRHWRSQETILLGLMEKAQTIADSIAVQNQLSQVQQQIEEITGRLNFLKNQTDLSTVQLTITETGVVPGPLDRWGFRTALSQAAHAFVDTVNGFVIVLGYALPLGLIGALIYAILRGMVVHRLLALRR